MIYENFHFWGVKFSVYLNRRVFAMRRVTYKDRTNATYETTDGQTKKNLNRGIALERSVEKLL